MKALNRLGLGTMGMSIVRNPENSIKTIHAALDAGITLFNTGEFYNASESELVVGQALKSGLNHPPKDIEAEVAAIYARKAAMKEAMEAKRKPREEDKFHC